MAAKTKKKVVPLAKMGPGAARNKRVAELARNPGTRSKIPTSLLPKQFQNARKTAQRIKTENATLYNPAQVLSGSDLRGAVKAEVNAEIQPKISAYDRGISELTGTRNTSSQRLGSYFDLYNRETAARAAGLSTGGQALADKISAAGQATQGALQGIQGDVDRRRQEDIALRGQGLQGDQNAQQVINQEKALAAGATQTAQNLGAAYSGGFAGIAGVASATAPSRAADAQSLLASKFNQQIAEMQGKKADVEATRGDLTTTTLDKMRQQQFTNLATLKGLDIKQSDLAETTRSHKATEALTGAAITQRDRASQRTAQTARERAIAKSATDKANLDIKRGIDPITGKRLPKNTSGADALNKFKLDFLKKHGYLPTTGKPKSSSGSDGASLTPNERVSQVGKFSEIYNTITQTVAPDFKGNRKAGGSAAARAFLKDNPNADPLYTSIALDQAYDGHISKANTQKLKRRGINVKDLNGVVSYTDWQKKRSRSRGARTNIPAFNRGLR